MNKFNHTEKIDFADKVKAYVGLLHQSVYSSLGENTRDFLIREVGYGIKIHDDYFYFDYPYSFEIDRLNDALADRESSIGDVDEILFSQFSNLQIAASDSTKGYIYYEYSLNEKEFITTYRTNLSSDSIYIHNCILKFLPIMHNSVDWNNDVDRNTVGNFYAPVHFDAQFSEPTYRLLYLNKVLADVTNPNANDQSHVITAAFIPTKECQDVESVVSELYTRIFPFLETFYDSPLLVKLMEEKRKSHVMAYQHSFGNIAPHILRLTRRIKKVSSDLNNTVITKAATDLKNCLYAQSLTLTAMFHTEANFQSATYYYDNHALDGKSLYAILHYYYRIANYLSVEADINLIDENYNKSDYIPRRDQLYDLHLIMWNLWENACRSAKKSDGTVTITLQKGAEGSILVSFKNNGILGNDFVEFINEGKSYPYQSSVNQSYKGLEIVGDKLKEKGWRWQYMLGRDISTNTETTEIIIIINLN